MSLVEDQFSGPQEKIKGFTSSNNYETIIVDDKQIKLQQICDSQVRLISSLENHIERLQGEVERLRQVPFATSLRSEAEAVSASDFTSTTIPTGIVLKSKFRENVEDLLRAKAIQKLEAEKEENS